MIPQAPAYTGLLESNVARKLLLTLSLLLVLGMALAELGTGTDRDCVNVRHYQVVLKAGFTLEAGG
jgi:hypothetical protein